MMHMLSMIKELKDEIGQLKTEKTQSQTTLLDGIPAELEPEDKPLPFMDRKLVSKPSVYSGDITKFPEWQEDLKRYLDMQDERFSQVLDKVEAEREFELQESKRHAFVAASDKDNFQRA